MIPHEQNQLSSKFRGFSEKPLVVHGICRNRALEASDLPQNAFGLASVLQVSYGSFIAICSECPEIIHGPESISAIFEDPKRVMDIAVGHNNILSNIIQSYDILPLKLGTVCRSQAQVRQLLDQNTERFGMCLDHIANTIEFGIKIIETGQAKKTTSDKGLQNSNAALTGQEYLHNQAKKLASKNHSVQSYKKFTSDLIQAMTFFVKETKILPMPKMSPAAQTRHIFNAAFLVDRGNIEAFKGCVKSYSEMAEPQNLAMSLSGPWPAYNFVSISH
ncbi:MAG: GvpL/GvpF family gas vesicle protein [Pseudomonadota bacterium]